MATLTLTLSADEQTCLVNALYAARDKYRECADMVAGQPGHDRMVQQFRQQVDMCETLIARIEV